MEHNWMELLQKSNQLAKVVDTKTLQRAVEKLVREYYGDDNNLAEYLSAAVDNIAVRLKNAAEQKTQKTAILRSKRLPNSTFYGKIKPIKNV